MKQLLEVMRTEHITIKWYELGVELLDNDVARKEIEANHPNNVDTCCRKMFEKWLEVKPDASWSQLVIALNKIRLYNAGDAVSKLYVLSGTITVWYIQIK